MGRLIVIEGLDSSGKGTQTKRLFNRLKDDEINLCMLEFPNYNSNSSVFVKMYLNGDFGKSADDVNPYASSTFFALDRFASYKTNWQKSYDNNTLVLCDRYVTSNMVHQASKIEDIAKKDTFLNWLWDLEYNIYSLPKPDLVIFLDMPIEKSIDLMKNRLNKFTNDVAKDIHESDEKYLEKSYNNAKYIAKKYNWTIINCVDEKNNLRTIEDISQDIYDKVRFCID